MNIQQFFAVISSIESVISSQTSSVRGVIKEYTRESPRLKIPSTISCSASWKTARLCSLID